jgi:hypothetical protein
VNNFLLPLSEDAPINAADANGRENLREVIPLSKRQLPLRLPKEQDPNIHSVGEGIIAAIDRAGERLAEISVSGRSRSSNKARRKSYV